MPDSINPASAGANGTGESKMKILQIVIPLLVIAICAVAVFFMVRTAASNANNIEGRFMLAGGGRNEYIELTPEGGFSLAGDEGVNNGQWTLSGGEFTFSAQNGESFTGVMIQSKYVVLKDDNFLSGEVPVSKDYIEASVKGEDGISYLFDTEGKFYRVEDGRNTLIGSYIMDGYFIVVTTDDDTLTYLNCGDGITNVYYQIV